MSGAVKQAEEVGAGDDTSLFLFIFRFYVMSFILLLLIFISLLLYLFIFPWKKKISWMFRVLGFIDAHLVKGSNLITMNNQAYN